MSKELIDMRNRKVSLEEVIRIEHIRTDRAYAEIAGFPMRTKMPGQAEIEETISRYADRKGISKEDALVASHIARMYLGRNHKATKRLEEISEAK